MFKKIVSIILTIVMCSVLPLQFVFAQEIEEKNIFKVSEPIQEINIDGEIFHIEKDLNKIYLKNLNTNERLLIASIEIENIFKRKSSTLLRASYSWTSQLEHNYSVKLEDTIYRLGWTNTIITSIIFYPIGGLGATVLANVANKFITDAFIDHLRRTQPEMLYVTVKYKEQVGCPFRKYYIATDLYLNSSRTKKWKSIPLNEEIFTGNRNDFTLPAACRL